MLKENYKSFMAMDISDYAGSWIAICNKKIVSSGKDIKSVFNEAKKKCPHDRPLITRVPTDETMIL